VKTLPEKIVFGGGCHRCTEAVFQALRGVSDVAQGFVRSTPPDDAWSEAVIVTFDPSLIDGTTLIEIHLRTHANTSPHKFRGNYRSAVYVFDDKQRIRAERDLQEIQAGLEEMLVTQVLSYEGFKPSDARFQNYYATDPERPFCRTYIDPKLQLLRKQFLGHVSNQETGFSWKIYGTSTFVGYRNAGRSAIIRTVDVPKSRHSRRGVMSDLIKWQGSTVDMVPLTEE
jgi:peptide-methionine (S)-S-oxide reductase